MLTTQQKTTSNRDLRFEVVAFFALFCESINEKYGIYAINKRFTSGSR